MDSILSEKQRRLLTRPLHAAFRPGRPFVAMANARLFAVARNPPLVPDVLVSLDVSLPASAGPDGLGSYLSWELGKLPDIVIEVVSNTEGAELRAKLRAYERLHVPHCVVFDPLRRLGPRVLTTFSLDGGVYTEREAPRFLAEGLALTLWEGRFEGRDERWLRWTDLDGNLLRTSEGSEGGEGGKGDERADAEKARADAETAGEAPPPRPRVDHLITEDGEPSDIFSEKQRRLLVRPLYIAFHERRPIVVMANVGLFAAAQNPALVPDVMVSLDLSLPSLSGPDGLPSYFSWELEKLPDIVIEIVSNADGGELREKRRAYERIHVPHYVVFDPFGHLGPRVLTTFSLDGSVYTEREAPRFVAEGLALTPWEGRYEHCQGRWLRWTDPGGNLLVTDEEWFDSANGAKARAIAAKAHADDAKAQADDAKAHADDAKAHADDAKAHADDAKARADALAEQLRELGVEPRR